MFVAHDLERQSGKGLVVRCLSRHQLAVLDAVADCSRDVDRRRQVVDDCVEQGLNALVLECGTAQNRKQLIVQDSGSQGCANFVCADFLGVEVLGHDVFVDIGHSFDQFFTRLGSRFEV